VDLHVVHTSRLRVDLATGVEIIPDCLEVECFLFTSLTCMNFDGRKRLLAQNTLFVTRGGIVRNI